MAHAPSALRAPAQRFLDIRAPRAHAPSYLSLYVCINVKLQHRRLIAFCSISRSSGFGSARVGQQWKAWMKTKPPAAQRNGATVRQVKSQLRDVKSTRIDTAERMLVWMCSVMTLVMVLNSNFNARHPTRSVAGALHIGKVHKRHDTTSAVNTENETHQ